MVDSVSTRAAGVSTTSPRLAPGGGKATTAASAAGTTAAGSAPGSVTDTVLIAASITAAGGQAGKSAERAQDTLSQMRKAQVKAAEFTQTFTRMQLTGLKKRLQLLVVMEPDPRKVAVGAALVARDAAHLAKDYSQAAIAKTAAGGSSASDGSGDDKTASSSDRQTAGSSTDGERQLETIKADATRAATSSNTKGQTDSDSDDADPNAPKNADARFFYDTYKLLAKAKALMAQAERQVQLRMGSTYNHAFAELHKFMGEVDHAVDGYFRDMVAAGVDLTTPTPASSTNQPLTLRVVA